jgi:CDP-glucose 4,6-dehydratase
VNRLHAEWRGRSVLVTGHSGFKGGWLALWLHRLGAEVHGFALNPLTEPSMYHVARLSTVMASECTANLADVASVRRYVDEISPEVVFHLAAQSLVRQSYADPLGTLLTNVIGTAHVLDAARHTRSVRAIVVVTTDKVYANREWAYPYREVDPLGGSDLYSASKAAAELITASYRASFLEADHVRVATARAGNVIGGGDWAPDRLLPDCIRAFMVERPITLRNPDAVRPWQHVLEPLSGYIALAGLLLEDEGGSRADSWNFGPDAGGDATVREVAELAAQHWSPRGHVEVTSHRDQLHEAGLLRLDNTRARALLRWRPRWSLDVAVELTVAWYRAYAEGADMQEVSCSQIRNYEESATL